MSTAPSAESVPAANAAAKPAAGWTLWLWVAAGFLFLSLLWTGMFMASRLADTRTVPLAKKGVAP